MNRPVISSVAAVFAGLAWLLTSFPGFDASVWDQMWSMLAGAALGAAGAWAVLKVVAANRRVDELIVEDERYRELTTIADVVGVLREPEVKP